jgi:hypothetical protein
LGKNSQFTYLRSVGAILSIFCGLVAIGVLWIGYFLVFDEIQVIPDFESTPREGWDYWMRLEFWHDIRSYTVLVLLALGGLLIPIFGLIRSGQVTSAKRVTDWILVGISALYLVLWSWGIVVAIRNPNFGWFGILPLIMFAGSLYGILVFWKRARRQLL